jgi:gas vesicle protein
MQMPPALNIPVKLNLDQLKNGLKETSALTGTATRAIAKGFIDANASVLATAGAVGTAVGGFRTLLGVLGPLALGITAVKGVFDLMGYATDLAKQKIEDFYQTAERAGKAGVSTDFFQRMTKSGETLKLTVDDINTALDKFANKSQAKLGGSDLDKRIAELTEAGNFKGSANVKAVSGAVGTEAKLRATVDLINEALSKGERLAALDLADKVFGTKIADNLRANSGYLKEMLDTADKMAASKIVSAEEIGRTIDLKTRLEDAQKVLTERLKPIQDDLAKLGMNYQESWVSITEYMAKAVGVGNDLYAALKEIPDILARAGSAPFWNRLTEFTGKLGLNSDPASLGLEPITSTTAGSPANAKLAGLLSNPAAVKKAMQDAIDAETKVLGDKSKAPTDKPKAPAADRDPFEVALDQGNRRIAIVDAETASIGKNSEARERAKIVATLEEAAKRANAAAGKELYGVTEATNPKIAEQADKMLAAAKAARVQETAFQGVQDALRYSGNQVVDILDQMGKKGANFSSIMANVFSNLSRQMLMAAITGEGAFAKLFGLAGTNGGVGGLMGVVGSMFGSNPLAGSTMSSGLGAGTGGLSYPMFAAGTDSAPGGMAWVGEKGPELVNLPRGTQVIPNDQSMRMTKDVPAFADGTGTAPMMGGQVIHVAPQIAVTVEGGSRGPQADEAMGANVAKLVDQSIRKIVASEIRTQRRPGGILR